MTGKPLLDKILMIFNLALLLGALGVFIYTEVIYQRPLPSDSTAYQEFMEEIEKGKYIETYKLDPVVVNLPSESQRLRFLNMELFIEPLRLDQLDQLNQQKDIILDRVIAISSRMTPDELNTVTGKLKLENRLKEAINRYMGRPTVKTIFFAKFVIQ